MSKWLVIALVIGVAVWWITRNRQAGRGQGPGEPQRTRQAPGQGPAPTPRGQRQPKAQPQPLPMVRCAHCDLLLPASDAVLDDRQRSYCSAEHRRAGARAVDES